MVTESDYRVRVVYSCLYSHTPSGNDSSNTVRLQCVSKVTVCELGYSV